MNVDVEQLAALGQLARERDVLAAGCRVAARMVVGQDQRRGAQRDGAANDVTDEAMLDDDYARPLLMVFGDVLINPLLAAATHRAQEIDRAFAVNEEISVRHGGPSQYRRGETAHAVEEGLETRRPARGGSSRRPCPSSGPHPR